MSVALNPGVVTPAEGAFRLFRGRLASDGELRLSRENKGFAAFLADSENVFFCFRRPMLYPIELGVHCFIFKGLLTFS